MSAQLERALAIGNYVIRERFFNFKTKYLLVKYTTPLYTSRGALVKVYGNAFKSQ